LFEDLAALVGLVAAFGGLLLTQVTGNGGVGRRRLDRRRRHAVRAWRRSSRARPSTC
jgi:hypothetical protein